MQECEKYKSSDKNSAKSILETLEAEIKGKERPEAFKRRVKIGEAKNSRDKKETKRRAVKKTEATNNINYQFKRSWNCYFRIDIRKVTSGNNFNFNPISAIHYGSVDP